MNELIHSVKSTFSLNESGVLAGNFKYYYVPLYQRGYKWTISQIEKLLSDINHFEYKIGKFYCVQNITLVPNEKNNCYNVVDGQQRLTTMTLILSVLGETEFVKGKLIFPKNSIRHYTNEFIQNWVIENRESPEDWFDFISENPEFDHQDIYHLFTGAQVIKSWLDNNKINHEQFKNKLLNHVKFICNVIEGEKEEKIFGNLNSKKVFLDGADLVRAILITRVTKENAVDESIKNVVRINERRVRIGWELDHINQWWNQETVQDYFKPFIQIKSGGDIYFDFVKNPINQLFALYAISKGWNTLSLEKIEQIDNTVQFYNELQTLHLELVDWFSNKKIYHYLGFLFHQSSIKPIFYNVLKFFRNECKTKGDFTDYLLDEIQIVLFGEEDLNTVFEKDKNWYEEDRLAPTLLFLDIIEALKENRNRLHVSAFLKKENDIEHIYPQTPKTESDKVGFLKYLIEAKPKILTDEKLSLKQIENLEEFTLDNLIEKYQDDITKNSVGNLVLLYYSLNRSIKNGSYAFKRKRILDFYNEGNYIQPHTLKVFSRYFQDGKSLNNDGKFWTQEDVEENENHIKKVLEDFFIKKNRNELEDK